MTPEQMQERLQALKEEWKQYEHLLQPNFASPAEFESFKAAHRAEFEKAKTIKEEMVRLRWALLSPEDREKAQEMQRLMQDKDKPDS
ncbi:hypothetical protein [Flaviaesturariibacter amylovorans]|uniref:Uncharacterized protein n=1 Tax=Flaviaesturariibacter amylovorans TaxID=1084520 RepID=A0ABP8GKZ3_9BACT